ncbi:DUF1707 SHOCT-like domain-containing protein [Actinomycetes bacterium M1A6_2h]
MTTDSTTIRASTEERENAATALREAAQSGRLTDAELDDRLAQASSAQHRHELDALLSDLPTAHSARRPATVRGAVASLFQAVVALAVRHKIVTIVVLVLVVAAIVASIWLGAWDFGRGHGMGGHGGGGHAGGHQMRG